MRLLDVLQLKSWTHVSYCPRWPVIAEWLQVSNHHLTKVNACD